MEFPANIDAVSVCTNHPARPSIGPCVRCGTFVCELCADASPAITCAPCQAAIRAGNVPGRFSFDTALGGGWSFFVRTFRPSAILSVIFAIPSAAAEIGGHRAGLSTLAAAMVTLLVQSTLGLVGGIAGLACMVAVAEGRTLSLSEAVRSGLRSFGRIFGAQFRAGVSIALGSVLCLIPGLYLAVRFAVVVPAAYLESGDALERSRSLVVGRSWEVTAVLLVTAVLVFVPAGLAGAIAGVIGFRLHALSLVLPFASHAIGRLAGMLYQGVMLAMYYGLGAEPARDESVART